MSNQTTSGLERQIGPFSGPYLDIGPDRDQVPKSEPFRKHCQWSSDIGHVNKVNHLNQTNQGGSSEQNKVKQVFRAEVLADSDYLSLSRYLSFLVFP